MVEGIGTALALLGFSFLTVSFVCGAGPEKRQRIIRGRSNRGRKREQTKTDQNCGFFRVLAGTRGRGIENEARGRIQARLPRRQGELRFTKADLNSPVAFLVHHFATHVAF